MPANKATARPWTLNQYDNHIGFSIYAGPFGCVCERWESNASEERQAELKANAEYILKAVNQHETLVNALEYCLWKLENTYAFIHLSYAQTPDGRPWHTKETYRETEEAKQFARAIEQAKKALEASVDE